MSVKEWLAAWIHLHVTAAWIMWRCFERFNDFMFSGMIRLAQIVSKEPVHHAVARVDTWKVKRLVRGGADLSEPDAKGATALHIALQILEEDVEESRVPSKMLEELIDWLIHNQTDLNRRDGASRAPIHVAIQAGVHELVQSLVDAGADPTLAGKGGKSTLVQATVQRDAEMVRLLLEAAAARAGADGGPAVPPAEFVNSMGRDGWGALGLAARVGDLAIVRALLDAGVDKGAVNKVGKTALELARLNKRHAVVALLEASDHRLLAPQPDAMGR